MDTVAKVGLIVVTVVAAIAFQGWVVMLAAMVINNYWASFPAFSFLEATVISMFIALFFGVVRGNK